MADETFYAFFPSPAFWAVDALDVDKLDRAELASQMGRVAWRRENRAFTAQVAKDGMAMLGFEPQGRRAFARE